MEDKPAGSKGSDVEDKPDGSVSPDGKEKVKQKVRML